ncbi:MAG: hypothetical protein OSB10_06520, partial [Planctomycetota bacterium]|nr:hypothetical protein [Planctomycetota bacterium]
GVHDSERDLQGCGLICAAAVLVLGILLAGAATHSDENDTRRSVTGIWFTKAPAGWIVQTEFGVFSGETQMR